jgi:hypothetical protein
MNFVFSSFRFFSDQPWTIPVIGILVASLAYLMGRRWLVPRSAPQKGQSVAEAVNEYLVAKALKAKPERRSCPRRREGKRVEVFLVDESKEEQIFGWVIDRSIGGLCLHVEKTLNEGAILSVRPCKAPPTVLWIPVEVRSCRAEGDVWEVGCRFLKPPQWNDLMFFG